MNLTLATAQRLARDADSKARYARSRAAFVRNNTDPMLRECIADADARSVWADARRDAVQRILRRKGFVVTVRPVGFCTIVEAP